VPAQIDLALCDEKDGFHPITPMKQKLAFAYLKAAGLLRYQLSEKGI
jgi:hypothetical protein